MILVTGGTGMVGSAFKKIKTNKELVFMNSSMCDLRDYNKTKYFFESQKPESVIHLAAKVGGIKSNMDNLATFYTDNIRINTNVLEACRISEVKKVVSLLSTCIYPDDVEYPLSEDKIHAGPPHSSNYGYAYAKRMLEVQSRTYRHQYGCNFITAIPNNLFGECDNYHLEDSHVIPAIIHKMYLANKNNTDVELWGDGSPLREFTYSYDLASILLFLLENYNDEGPINVGNTIEISIKSAAEKIKKHMNYTGEIKWNTKCPTGQFRKPSDNSKLLSLGWEPTQYTDFDLAIKNSCNWFVDNYPNIRGL